MVMCIVSGWRLNLALNWNSAEHIGKFRWEIKLISIICMPKWQKWAFLDHLRMKITNDQKIVHYVWICMNGQKTAENCGLYCWNQNDTWGIMMADKNCPLSAIVFTCQMLRAYAKHIKRSDRLHTHTPAPTNPILNALQMQIHLVLTI